MYFSSGDDGDEVVNGLDPQPDYPASDTLVTAVGGTSELTNKKGASTITTGWETALDLVDFTGTKAQYSEPLPGFFWVVPAAAPARSSRSRTTSGRQFRRRSRTGTASGCGSCRTSRRTQTPTRASTTPTPPVATTSSTRSAAPAWPPRSTAGIQAVAEQNRAFPIGFANPMIYSMRANAFNDVTPRAPLRFASVGGSYTGTFEAGDTQSSRYGYDDITGRGTPNGTTFLKAERH